ncbi:MAG: PAS domain-containing protein [Loktanella sp.]|nr:PAS domain-containing protein [Loktanella sp.]
MLSFIYLNEMSRHDLILNAAGKGICRVNADGNTTFVNRAVREMLGWSAQDLLDRDIYSMIHHHQLNGENFKHWQGVAGFAKNLLMFLSAFPINCLPLPNRREDIPALPAHVQTAYGKTGRL